MLCENFRAAAGAIGHNQLIDAQFAQVRRSQRGHHARTEHQRGFSLQGVVFSVVVTTESHAPHRFGAGKRHHGGPCVINVGFRMDPLARVQGALRQCVQGSTHRVVGIGLLVGTTHLPNDLLLPHHHGIQPGGHHEHVLSCSIGVMHVEVATQHLGGQPAFLMQHLNHIVHPSVEAGGDSVHLHPVTGGYNHGFREGGSV